MLGATASMPKKSPPKTGSAPDSVALNIRIPAELMAALDAWIGEENKLRSWPKLTRSDLVRGVLEWAARTRPNWEGK